MPDKKQYWFAAKTYGWGWGLPTVWQGWLVYGTAAVLLIAGVFIFPPAAHPVLFQMYIWAVLVVLPAQAIAIGSPGLQLRPNNSFKPNPLRCFVQMYCCSIATTHRSAGCGSA